MKKYFIVFVVGLVIVCMDFKYRALAQSPSFSKEGVEREIRDFEAQKRELETEIRSLKGQDLSDYEWVNPLTRAKTALATVESKIHTRKMYLKGDRSSPY